MALLGFILVRTIQTIIISITNINSWNTIAIVTSEQISKASFLLTVTILFGFITAIITVSISITIPRGRNTSVVRTPETVWWTLSLCTGQHVLVTVVSTIIVTITEPVWLHTNGGGLTLPVPHWTGHIHILASLHRLITSGVIFTIINSITDTSLGNTSIVSTGELSLGTCIIITVSLISTIPTIILMITLPGL